MHPRPVEERNRDVVVAELALLRARIRGDPAGAALESLRHARRELGLASTLDSVVEAARLTPFERDVLLLAAGPDLVAETADDLVAAGCGARLTFGAALALLDGAHWSALTPTGPLRRWDLVRPAEPSAPTASPLVVDERVLHHLAGAGDVDPELAMLSWPAPPVPDLPRSLLVRAREVVEAWRGDRAAVLHGPQPGNLRTVAAAAAALVGMQLRELAGIDLPPDAAGRARLVRLLGRESVLSATAWAVDLSDARAEDAPGIARALVGCGTPLVLLDGGPPRAWPRAVPVEVPRLEPRERREVLTVALRRHGAAVAEEVLDEVAGVFDLPVGDLEEAARETAAGTTLWHACRERSRPHFDGLAETVTPRAGWDDLVLPEAQRAQLRALVAAVRHRTRVLDQWGLAARSSRSQGATALFAGPSGTGKTMAAEVIAGDLGLDLVRVDLSQLVDKYIGETEKNLKRVFDAAEDCAAVLLFDEADALFGRRTEVHDSHDRYANVEVGYLLQRLESFRGIAVLTTNARSAIDQAFLRRLRVLVTFPYPDLAARVALWQRAFPPSTPTRGLDPARLAAIDLPGGGITAAALTASYLAADDGEPVSEDHVRRAARWELSKSGRTAATVGPAAAGSPGSRP
ncbi:ATP-binding protein [Georgenia subflava]|uniref:AAA family ATPase n=1 Tax=Georgenia subflava TaxID=1622177 RepID=A0A6N7EIR1_9MICO|nr:ATP-binding protein [Georgenia subflava]MPV37311.1 AAA family ATPase [Georgenia subflava]